MGWLPLGFASPLVLFGLLSLPVLWWLLRLIPPRPRRIDFPPARILFEIAPKEETPSRTPWWLTLLRLALAALVIFAAAGPLWNPPVATSAGSGPVVLLIDDGWAAAASWEARQRTADELIARAEADRRGVAIVPLSEPTRDVSILTANVARVRLQQLKPKPHAVNRIDTLPVITRFVDTTPTAELVWMADGIDAGGSEEFVKALGRVVGDRRLVIVAGGVPTAHALTGADNAAGALTVNVLRAPDSGTETGTVRALDLKGLPLGEAIFAFKNGEREAVAKFDLPVEIRNDIARLEIPSERSAGAVQLLDKRWRRRSVGVISGATADNAQPLLAATFYLTRALNPFADVRLAQGGSPSEAVSRFLDQKLPMLILADVGTVAGDSHDRLSKWIDDGGVLVRFAGPRLAAATTDTLVPVKLRRGGRILGGSLSWDQPQQLAAFSRESPFFGMPIPNDVTVTRQVLAEPDANLSDRTWATLGDGTPLVTAEKRGKGLVILFHVTADTRWSDLPLSGAMVEMLKRTVALAGTTTTNETTANGNEQAREVVPPSRVLDGFGTFGPAPPTARPVATAYAGRADAEHPPGFYGPPEGLLAVNTFVPADRLKPLDVSPLNARLEAYRVTEPQDLRGPILLLAMLLLLIDALVVFWLNGGLSRLTGRRRAASATAAALLIAISASQFVAPSDAFAQEKPQLQMQPRDGSRVRVLIDPSLRTPGQNGLQQVQMRQTQARPARPNTPPTNAEEFAMQATLETRLAYVTTGNAEVDAISKSGLSELTVFLAQRTALEAGEPAGVDISKDELSFFPLIYWPVVPGATTPSPDALKRIDAYMKQGGTVLFDTRDAVEAVPGNATNSPGMQQLRTILSSLDIPELEPLPRDHVLNKTFFLLKDFPGRFASGQLWVEASAPANNDEEPARPARAGDGVSSILITSNDFAGAWATRPDRQPMLPMVPGEPRQREMAFRSGVNIVMYTLTGNYKADQVHVPALLERLGQ